MIKKLTVVQTSETNPHKNIAMEHYLLENVENDEIIMYLWQNYKTVVIGKNQNCHTECKVEKLYTDGGFLARRLSGGGAVFHDLGNLNFTFIAKSENYNVERQTNVILNAVLQLGINAVRTGRNDIHAQGRKFSGNAFYKSGNKMMHHGTLLLNTDIFKLSEYLTVQPEKLKSHGVKSVKSHVVNLCELNSQITPTLMCEKLIYSFEKEYGLKSINANILMFNEKRIDELYKIYKSDDWCKGKLQHFSYVLKRRFSWGFAELCFNVNGNTITSAALYTDALCETLPQIICDGLINTPFNKNTLAHYILSLIETNEELKDILLDINCLIKQEFEN